MACRHEQGAREKNRPWPGAFRVEIEGVAGVQEWEISGSEGSLKIKFGDDTVSRRGLPDAVCCWRSRRPDRSAKTSMEWRRLTAQVADPHKLDGSGVFPGGESFSWSAQWRGPLEEEGEKREDKDAGPAPEFDRYPAGAFGVSGAPPRPASTLIRGGTVWTSGKAGKLERADVVIQDGKIARVAAEGVKPPRGGGGDRRLGQAHHAGAHRLPLAYRDQRRRQTRGRTRSPSRVRVGDVVDPTDIGIYRQLAVMA